MSFVVKFQKNISEDNRLVKSVVDLKSTSCVLKSDCSLQTPTLIVEGAITDFITCNYCSIDSFGRKYFVDNITSVSNTRLEITCHCDVLSSFADEIKANTGIVLKGENTFNLYLNDGTFKTYQNPNVLTKKFPNGFTKQEFVLAVAGN